MKTSLRGPRAGSRFVGLRVLGVSLGALVAGSFTLGACKAAKHEPPTNTPTSATNGVTTGTGMGGSGGAGSTSTATGTAGSTSSSMSTAMMVTTGSSATTTTNSATSTGTSNCNPDTCVPACQGIQTCVQIGCTFKCSNGSMGDPCNGGGCVPPLQCVANTCQ